LRARRPVRRRRSRTPRPARSPDLAAGAYTPARLHCKRETLIRAEWGRARNRCSRPRPLRARVSTHSLPAVLQSRRGPLAIQRGRCRRALALPSPRESRLPSRRTTSTRFRAVRGVQEPEPTQLVAPLAHAVSGHSWCPPVGVCAGKGSPATAERRRSRTTHRRATSAHRF
jgi:hypothetical protein